MCAEAVPTFRDGGRRDAGGGAGLAHVVRHAGGRRRLRRRRHIVQIAPAVRVEVERRAWIVGDAGRLTGFDGTRQCAQRAIVRHRQEELRELVVTAADCNTAPSNAFSPVHLRAAPRPSRPFRQSFTPVQRSAPSNVQPRPTFSPVQRSAPSNVQLRPQTNRRANALRIPFVKMC